ncbi:hypothetical protein GCM10010256_60860 [Streptomyces coeruleorubidus]|nr:hypothetical protein GCM10010256_60860 [Streptomyces coeruleorubidus]
MSREPNAQLIAVMDEAKVSNKGLAKRMQDAAAQRGITLGTTHVSVKRWREGAGIQPQAAAIMADVLSVKLGRRVSPGDLASSISRGRPPLSRSATQARCPMHCPRWAVSPTSAPTPLPPIGSWSRTVISVQRCCPG